MTNDIQVGLGTLLRRAIAALDGGAQQVYDRYGAAFRPRYYPVARHLLDHGSTGVSQLSERLGMTQPAISQTLKEMARDGLVGFAPDGDRRVRLVRLSDDGLRLCSQLQPVWAAAAESADELGAEIGADLPDLLDRLLTALERQSFAARIEEKLS